MQRRALLGLLAASPLKAALRLEPRFSSRLKAIMDAAAVPGLVVGAVQQGKPGWIRGLGATAREDGRPVDATTLFQAASLTKQVTAYAAHALHGQGKLDFARPLVSYIDDLTD
ncbi:MAG: beta-lactamase family protein, partial [Bryobacterales bacterium]|nr:beta-lactamase family protein [Bryobacterales bacterium]